MTTTFHKKATRFEEALVWYHFVPASGPDGLAWYEMFRSSGGEALGQDIDVSVALMRSRKVDAGKQLLDQCRDVLEAPAMQSQPRAIAGVIEEGYWGAQAYYHYHRGQYDDARRALDHATDRITEVVAAAPCLVAFATKCYDFCLHRTRIARSEVRWREMWRCIQDGREMLAGARPLCRGRHGVTFIADAEAFYETVTPADDLERRALDMLRDRSAMIASYEKRALGASQPPGIVVDY
jgi:hypothetical protein